MVGGGYKREGDVVREQGMSHQGSIYVDNSWINSRQRHKVCSGENPSCTGSQNLETAIPRASATESCKRLAQAFPALQLRRGCRMNILQQTRCDCGVGHVLVSQVLCFQQSSEVGVSLVHRAQSSPLHYSPATSRHHEG